MLVPSRVGYTRRGTTTIFGAVRKNRGFFRGTEHEPYRAHLDGCRLCAEPRLLCSLLERRPRAHRAVRNSVPRAGASGTLFRTLGAFAGIAHRPVSRFVRFDVSVRLAAGADISGTGAVSQAALRRSVCPTVHPGVLSRG